MRTIGTRAYGIRLPIINPGDSLAEIVCENLINACKSEGLSISDTDVVGVTEAIVAKAQGNYATGDDLSTDIKNKFGGGVVGVVSPILSRNRFLNILKGIAKGVDKVVVLLSFPADEQGNSLIDAMDIDDFYDKLDARPFIMTAEEFQEKAGKFYHPFTGIDYISLYQEAADNVEVYISDDPRQILKLTKNVIVCDVHSRFLTKKRLLKAGAEKVYTLSDILNEPVREGAGFNPDYGVLGSNLSKDGNLKLFPKDCDEFVASLRKKIFDKTGENIEVMIYGDGAFKDPACGIWELADPVVSPAYTERLNGQPAELKLKYIADINFQDLRGEEKTKAITEIIKNKNGAESDLNLKEGTTPRKYADLLGSLCDLVSGSGDKGTPVILIKGYFDDYSTN